MNGKALPIILLCCALAVGVLSACLLYQEKWFMKHAVRTQARVCAVSPIGGNGQLVPVVEFTAEDGQQVRRPAQRAGAFGVKEGDQVEVLYTRRNVVGMDAWNVFVVKNQNSAPYRVYSVVGVIFGVIAAGLAVAGVMLGLR